jgi:hypothetical protein
LKPSKYFIICFASLFYKEVNSQTVLKTNSNAYSFQYGFSLKATVELNLSQYKPKPVCRISADVGVGSDFLSSWLYPSFNFEVDLYNGGQGSESDNKFFSCPWDFDIITAMTLTAGTKNHLTTERISRLSDGNIPLYYFFNYVHPALQNPFDFSGSVGTNIIFTLSKEKKNQRVGFINFHNKRFQVTYFNDGGFPIEQTHLGDGKDRYYSGGIIFSYHGKPGWPVNLVEFGYEKFTGFTLNAFELSNLLSLNYMNYRGAKQREFNKGQWALNIGNPAKGWSVKLINYNSVDWDLQHYIHSAISNAYHMVPYKSYWALSGSYFKSFTAIGIQ